ncbi:MAG: peptide chain release factor N(5)-glutamine methyltransferase [Planctomycetota bacterium]
MTTDSHTVMSVLRAAEGWLAQRGVDAPKRSAELLLGKVLGLDRLKLYLQHDRPMGEPERAAMRALLARRGRHEPVAHLLGSWSFRGFEIEVSPAVLIPRPETEELVDLALARLAPGARVVDLGTGSGAIAVALASERDGATVVATDVSRNALAVAARNVARHDLGERVALRHGSWWDACADDAPFDLLVSNPPYVDPDRPELLEATVRDFEPPLALFTAPGDPGSCYREIAAGIAAHLRPGAAVVLETGVGASDAALAVLRATPELDDVALLADLAGQPRFVVARRI